MGVLRTLARSAVVLVGAAIGLLVGCFGALLLWVAFSDSTGADEPFIGGLVMAVIVVVPITTVAGGVIAWRSSRSRGS